MKPEYLILGGLAVLGVYLVMQKGLTGRIVDRLASFIPSVEGFRSTPYWDVSRYSWGYGTAAPGATGTITREQAFKDMVTYLLADYGSLSSRITRSLTVNQWAALLSFSYNLGIGNAYNLVSLINAGDNSNLGVKWNKYVYAGGSVNQDLVNRRAKEWALWNT